MTSVIHFGVAFAILIASSLNSVDANYNKYVSLVTAVREHYRTSSAFFIFSKNNQRMQEYTMVHMLTRIFSRHGAVTMITIFRSLNTRLNTYKQQMVPPLIVVMLASPDDIVEFDNSVEPINKSYPIWLVIFRGSAGQSICAYCTNPVGNMFSLRFDTLMLVVCCDSPTIQQWWSVHENQTVTHNFASWRANEGLKLLEVEQLRAKRHDVFGTELRLVIIPNSPLIRVHSDNHIGGFFGQVLTELKVAMNFTTKSMRRLESYGSYNLTTKKWSGAMELLSRGDVDIGFADFTITDSRLDTVDFTTPLLVSSFQLFIKQPDYLDVQWIAYFKVFTLEIWLAIIFLLMTSPVLLAIIKVKRVSFFLLSVSIETYLNVWGIFCQQGLLEFPAEMPLRIGYLSIFVSALIVSAAYSASLISFLTLSSPSLPFTSLKGFAADKSYKLIVSRHSADYELISNSNAPIARQMMELMKPLEDLPISSRQAWPQVCAEKVAFYTSLMIKSMTPNIPCKVVGIPTGRVESLAIALPANSQYTKVVNHHIARFKSNGMFKRLQEEFSIRNEVEPPIKFYNDVEFSGIVPILSILTGGIILAFIVLFSEIIHNTVNYRRQRSLQKMQRKFLSHKMPNSYRKKKKRGNSFFDH